MAHYVSVRNGMTSSDEKDLSNIAVAFVSSGGGVVGANDYLIQAQSTPNNTVLVNTGRAYVPTSDGSMVYSTHLDASQNVTISANSSGNARTDSIVLYIDLSASVDAAADNVAKFYDVAGPTDGTQNAPTNSQILTAIGSSNPYIILANIAVANGFVSINSGNITDKRAFAKISGGDTTFQSSLGNFVSSGITIPTSANLTATSTSGVMYYNGIQISVASDGGHTYTASNDTYVDVSNAGAYNYQGVANGATSPSLTANSIRVAKVVTSGTAITSVVQNGSYDALQNIIYPNDPRAVTTKYYTPAASGTATLSFSGNAKRHVIQMPAGNITIALPTGYIPQFFEIEIIQDSVGSRTVTWFSTIDWTQGTAPTLTTTASKKDTFGFLNRTSGTFDGYTLGQNI